MRQLRLVETFSELRRGMIVVDLACDCGHLHEVELVRLAEFKARESKPADGVAWVCLPDCLPDTRDPDHFNGIDDKVVCQRRVFLVVDVEPVVGVREREKVNARR